MFYCRNLGTCRVCESYSSAGTWREAWLWRAAASFMEWDVVIKKRQDGGIAGSIFIGSWDTIHFRMWAYNEEWPVIVLRSLSSLSMALNSVIRNSAPNLFIYIFKYLFNHLQRSGHYIYCTVVTICTASLTFNNSITIPIYETVCVYSAVLTGSLNKSDTFPSITFQHRCKWEVHIYGCRIREYAIDQSV